MAIVQAPLRVRPDSPHLRLLASDAARRNAVSEHEVFVRLLLHLPRKATEAGVVDPRFAVAEADRLAGRLSFRTSAYRALTRPPPDPLEASDLSLVPVDDAVARVVLERFHYLESFRRDSAHYAGMAGTDRLAALLTLSSLDVGTIAQYLPARVSAEDVLVVSRVFAFGWAPPNALSFLLARLVRSLRARQTTPRLLLTYLNPNVGFTGASYRAANWRLWAHESGTQYAYVDGDYITDRELAARFGTGDPQSLARALGDRIAFSRMPLKPLQLYAYPIDVRLRPGLHAAEPVDLPHPSP